MADWSRVGAEHVREAAALYESGERRPAKPARNTFLLLEGGCYPAKFVRMLAHEMATGVALDPSVDLSGGMETVRFLNRLGFDVKHAGRVFAGAGAATPRRTGGTKGPLSTSFHSAEGAMKKGIPPGEKEGGSVDFARKGLAGAARQWRVPVFAAVHFQAGVQERWPTGVVWRRGNQSVRSWRYDDNPLSPMVTEWVEHGDEAAHLKFYNLGHAIRASSASTRSA